MQHSQSAWDYMTIRISEARVLFEGWTKFLAVTLQQADGRSTERAVLDHGASVCVLPYDPERRLALVVCQTRVPLLYLGCREQLMEAIAGRVEDEQPLEAVRREAMEEAGLRIGHTKTLLLAQTLRLRCPDLFD
jgi:8-oxo-dGTP pyrophosphatase MutT (NUDIX family)